MKTKVRSKADPIEREIERALRPGAFIRDGESISFVISLNQVAATIAQLVPTESARAIELYETFLAGCHAKADDLDDSSGSFGQFAQDIICGWIKARQTSGADPEKTVSTLLAWMDDDPYAFCYEIEKSAAAAFDTAGLAAFGKQIRSRDEEASAEPSSWPYRRNVEILRAIYCAQGDAQAYIALAEQTGLRPEDCLAVAKLLGPRKPNEALTWVERGRVPLMKFVPKVERAAWHEKAMDAAHGADLRSLLELFVETKETERLAELVRGSPDEALENVSHYVTGPAAKRLEKSHPGLGARLWRAQGMRIVDAKKSKYYDAALSNFERARDCYQRATLPAEWEKTVRRVSAYITARPAS